MSSVKRDLASELKAVGAFEYRTGLTFVQFERRAK